MTAMIWFALVMLAGLATFAGRVDVALLCACVKTLLVGLHFMELRHAARLHTILFAAWATTITALLLLLLLLR